VSPAAVLYLTIFPVRISKGLRHQ